METIVMRILIWTVFGAVSCLFSGCSLVTCAAGGGFNFSSSPYSSWESFKHDGEKFLISPHGKNEYYIRKYDCFLWGSVDRPVKMMIGSFFLQYKGFPYFSIYHKGETQLLDVRENPERHFDADGYGVRVQIRYRDGRNAFVTVTNPRGNARRFEMLLRD